MMFAANGLKWKFLMAVTFVAATYATEPVQAGIEPATGIAHQSEPLQKVRAAGQLLITSDQRLLVPHGVNAVYKRPPYYPDATELTQEDIDSMAALGFNTVRLGIIWKGLEPCEVGSEGCSGYDETYLDQIERRVNQFNAKGIYVLLDFHQDIYGDRQHVGYWCLDAFCTLYGDYHGEGAPDWATENSNGYLGLSLGDLWGGEYFYKGVKHAFRNLLAPNSKYPRFAEHYRAAWQHVAERFKAVPGVLGYDLFNEPSHGVLRAGLAKRLDVKRLQPFFQSLIEAVREVDYNHVIYYEPNVTNDFGPPFTMPPAFNPRDSADNLGLSYHVYCIVPGFGLACDAPQAATVAVKKRELQQRAITGLITEFGSSNDFDDIGYTMDIADINAQGWNYWQWKFWSDPTGAAEEWVADEDGTLNQQKVQQLARTYPMLIAADNPELIGSEPSWCFSRADLAGGQASLCDEARLGHFKLTYNASNVGGITRVYVPVNLPIDSRYQIYRQGYSVTKLEGAKRISAPNARVLEIQNETTGTVTLELDAIGPWQR